MAAAPALPEEKFRHGVIAEITRVQFGPIAPPAGEFSSPSANQQLLRHLEEQLAQNNNGRQLFVHVHQEFSVNDSLFVVTDIEIEQPLRKLATCGYITNRSSIFFGSTPLSPLTRVKLALLRPAKRQSNAGTENSSSPPSAGSSATVSGPSIDAVADRASRRVQRWFRQWLPKSPSTSSSSPTPAAGPLVPTTSSTPPGGGGTSSTSSRHAIRPLVSPRPYSVVDLRKLLLAYLEQFPHCRLHCGQILKIPFPPGLWSLRTRLCRSLPRILEDWPEEELGNPFECFPAAPSLDDDWPVLEFMVKCFQDEFPGVGFVDLAATQVTVELDPIGCFERILVAPLRDTVPQSYDFNFFEDYVIPYFAAHPFRIVRRGEVLQYHGVQFKVMNAEPGSPSDSEMPDRRYVFWRPHTAAPLLVEPRPSRPLKTDDQGVICDTQDWRLHLEWLEAKAAFMRGLEISYNDRVGRRVGPSTEVYRGQVVTTHWTDVLPPHTMETVRRLPSRLQPWAIMRAVGDLPPQELIRVLGVEDMAFGGGETLLAHDETRDKWAAGVVAAYSTPYAAISAEEPIDCVVCLSALETGEKHMSFPCGHGFHAPCTEQWLRRSIYCPVCKRDIPKMLQIDPPQIE